MSTLPSPPSSLSSLATCEAVALAALGRPAITRRDLIETIDVSPATVTNHTRWLLTKGLFATRPVKLPHSQRPVDHLMIDGSRGTSLALTMSAQSVTGDLLALDGQVVKRFGEAVASPCQHDVLQATRLVVQSALEACHQRPTELNFVGVSVIGYVNANPPIVYGMDGVADWNPCDLRDVLPSLNAPCEVWTDVASKVRCLGADLENLDRICYIEVLGPRLHYATMRQGIILAHWP